MELLISIFLAFFLPNLLKFSTSIKKKQVSLFKLLLLFHILMLVSDSCEYQKRFLYSESRNSRGKETYVHEYYRILSEARLLFKKLFAINI